jgi:hypothetical protein
MPNVKTNLLIVEDDSTIRRRCLLFLANQDEFVQRKMDSPRWLSCAMAFRTSFSPTSIWLACPGSSFSR